VKDVNVKVYVVNEKIKVSVKKFWYNWIIIIFKIEIKDVKIL